jgi:hypothetical protein
VSLSFHPLGGVPLVTTRTNEHHRTRYFGSGTVSKCVHPAGGLADCAGDLDGRQVLHKPSGGIPHPPFRDRRRPARAGVDRHLHRYWDSIVAFVGQLPEAEKITRKRRPTLDQHRVADTGPPRPRPQFAQLDKRPEMIYR